MSFFIQNISTSSDSVALHFSDIFCPSMILCTGGLPTSYSEKRCQSISYSSAIVLEFDPFKTNDFSITFDTVESRYAPLSTLKGYRL